MLYSLIAALQTLTVLHKHFTAATFLVITAFTKIAAREILNKILHEMTRLNDSPGEHNSLYDSPGQDPNSVPPECPRYILDMSFPLVLYSLVLCIAGLNKIG